MDWGLQATSHYLSPRWAGSMSPYGVIKPPQPVKDMRNIGRYRIEKKEEKWRKHEHRVNNSCNTACMLWNRLQRYGFKKHATWYILCRYSIIIFPQGSRPTHPIIDFVSAHCSHWGETWCANVHVSASNMATKKRLVVRVSLQLISWF